MIHRRLPARLPTLALAVLIMLCAVPLKATLAQTTTAPAIPPASAAAVLTPTLPGAAPPVPQAVAATVQGQTTQGPTQSPTVAPNGPAAAVAPAAPDLFAVTDVDVDVTASDAAAARDQAIAQAQRKAFVTLYRRLTPPQSPSPPAIGDTQLAQLVQGFEVQREKTSAVRYLATLTIRFQPAAVRSFLSNAGISFADTQSKPILILPIYRPDQGTPVLWEQDTAWHDAWSTAAPGSALAPIVVPLGDLKDLTAVNVDDALAGKTQGFSTLTERYGAGDVLVAVLNGAAGGPDPNVAAQVTLHRYGAGNSVADQAATVPAAPGKSVADYLAGGIAPILSRLEQDWKQETTLASRDQHQMVVTEPIARLDDWVHTRERLSQVPLVVRSDLQAMSRTQVTLTLTYMGDPDRLRTALAQRDLDLTVSGPDSGQLRWSGAQP